MKELLIIKAGDSYLRFLPEGHQLCKMDKASVFPLSQIAQVRKLCRQAEENGMTQVEIRKLTIIEEPYPEGK